MQEEIFGPVMPILTYSNLDVVINKINSMPSPLALYIFTNNKQVAKKVTSEVSFGGGCINDVVIHLATSNMGFGGVGESGMGSYLSLIHISKNCVWKIFELWTNLCSSRLYVGTRIYKRSIYRMRDIRN